MPPPKVGPCPILRHTQMNLKICALSCLEKRRSEPSETLYSCVMTLKKWVHDPLFGTFGVLTPPIFPEPPEKMFPPFKHAPKKPPSTFFPSPPPPPKTAAESIRSEPKRSARPAATNRSASRETCPGPRESFSYFKQFNWPDFGQKKARPFLIRTFPKIGKQQAKFGEAKNGEVRVGAAKRLSSVALQARSACSARGECFEPCGRSGVEGRNFWAFMRWVRFFSPTFLIFYFFVGWHLGGFFYCNRLQKRVLGWLVGFGFWVGFGFPC